MLGTMSDGSGGAYEKPLSNVPVVVGDADRCDQVTVGADRELAGCGAAIVEGGAPQHPRRRQRERRVTAGADDARADSDSEHPALELPNKL